MKRKFTGFFLSIGFIFVAAVAAAAATLTVDTADGGAQGSCTTNPNDCSLLGAVLVARSGDTINFDPAVFSTPQTITITSGGIPIRTNVTIIGPGADKLTVTAGGNSVVFTVDDFTVNISGMTVTGGNGAFFGGISAGAGALTNSGTLAITNCVFTGNSSNGFGSTFGAILNNKNLTVTGSTLSTGGLLSGMPVTSGAYTFTVMATDTDQMAGVRQYSL